LEGNVAVEKGFWLGSEMGGKSVASSVSYSVV
jgi:hypothetical protein